MKDDVAAFHLVYDGSALTSHEMNVRDLAPALLAVGELLEDASKIVNGPRVKTVVNLKATEAGCVDVCLTVSQSLLDQAVGLFSGPGVTAVLNAVEILALIGLSVGKDYEGLINLIRWQKNRPIKSVVKLESGDYKIEVEGGEIKQVSIFELNLFKHLSIRKHIETMIKMPLQKPGIDSVRFTSRPTEKDIQKDEAEYFSTPSQRDESLGDPIVSTEVLQLVSVVFQEGNKWKFSNGSSVFFADVKDEEFLEQIANSEIAFSKNDLIEVDLEKRQFLISETLKTEYAILKVKEHRSALVQLKLPISDDKSDDK